MNKAHVFQHNTTGVQIFVYHCSDEYSAKLKFFKIVISHEDWLYLGEKIAELAKQGKDYLLEGCSKFEK